MIPLFLRRGTEINMPSVSSPAISSSLFFLVPLLLLVLAFQPSSTPRPSVVLAQFIQTLIAILAVLVATLGLVSLYKAEMVVEALFVFVLQSTSVYIIISLSSFGQYAIALIVLLSSATLFSFLTILVQLPAALNYLPPILFISFCLVTFMLLFRLIFPNRSPRPISLPKTDQADQLYSINFDTVESGVPPAQDNLPKTILLVSFASQFFFLLFCILRLSSLAFLTQDTAKNWAIKTAQTILLILSSLCSTYVFSQYAYHQGLQYGNQKRFRLAAAPFCAFKTVDGLCGTSSGASGTSDAFDAGASASSEAPKTSIILDAFITSTASMSSVTSSSGASEADKRAYTNINSYSKDDNNDSTTLSPSPSVSVLAPLSRQSRWSRFIALASRPTISMANLASLAPPATDTAAISEECRVNSRFALDIGRPSTFPSFIPSIPSISSGRSTAPSIHSIYSNPSVFGSIDTLYTLPNDAQLSMDITTSVTGVTGETSTVTITGIPFLHPAAATLSNSQNSHNMTTLTDTYDMTADYGLVDYAGSYGASTSDQSLCPLAGDLDPHRTYSTNQDRVLAFDVPLDTVVTAIPLLYPATATSQTSQDKTILAYKHNMATDYADSVTSYGIVRYTDEIASRGASVPDKPSCPLSRDLTPHSTCLTNQDRVLASNVSLDAAVATTALDFDSVRTRLIGHKESMHSITSFASTPSPSSSTTTLGISTTTSMQNMHERTVSWSSSSVAFPGTGRRNVAMKMKMTGGVPLGKCVPLDVLSRNFLQDEDEVGTESPDSLTPDLEFLPRLDDSEYPGNKRTKSRGSRGRSMPSAAALEMGNAAYNLPDIGEENVKKSRSGSMFLFGGWGRLGGVREDEPTQDQEREQGQGRGHRRHRSHGLSLSLGRMMRGRSLSISFLSGLMRSRPKKDENDDEETQRVLGDDSIPSSTTPSLVSGSEWSPDPPMFSSLSLTFSKGMTGNKAAINTSRSTLVTTSSGTTPNASPSSTPTSHGKKANWKTIKGKKSSMTMDDTHHGPADFMDMRDPFAPPVLGVRARTSPSSSSLITPPSPCSSPLPGGNGRTKGRGRERDQSISCPSPCPPTPTPGSAISSAQQQHEGLLDVEEALLTQRLLMRLDLSPSPF